MAAKTFQTLAVIVERRIFLGFRADSAVFGQYQRALGIVKNRCFHREEPMTTKGTKETVRAATS
jgi:hypothetical protein